MQNSPLLFPTNCLGSCLCPVDTEATTKEAAVSPAGRCERDAERDVFWGGRQRPPTASATQVC